MAVLAGAAAAAAMPARRCSRPLLPPLQRSYLSRMWCQAAAARGWDGGGRALPSIPDVHVAEAVKIVLEMARRASSRREILHTDFLTPPVVKESMALLERLADTKAVAQGGYPQAERCRITIGHCDVMTSNPDVVTALSISGNFRFAPCSHGDFLGAILGTGIAREKVGDILLQEEKGAQVLVVPELVEFLQSTLDKVGNVGVSCTQIPLLALEYEPPSETFLQDKFTYHYRGFSASRCTS